LFKRIRRCKIATLPLLTKDNTLEIKERKAAASE
jgi:hypothetical protein